VVKIKSITSLLLAFLLTFNLNAQEVTKTGTTAAKFLSIGIGPRANAMGAAYTSVANDASAMYWNPAGIASLKKTQALFTYTKMFADINLNYFGLVIPVGDYGNLGVNITAINYGKMEVTTEMHPDGIGETFSAGSYAFGLSYARYITENFIVGVNFKYIREDISSSSAQGFAFDIGTIFTTPFYGVKFATSIANYGTKMQMRGDDLIVQHDTDPQRNGNNSSLDAYLATDAFDLPLRLQIGLSRDFEFMKGQRFTFAVDANYPNDNKQWVNVGGELALFDETVFIRGGYKTLFLEDSQEGLTFGFGLHYYGFGAFILAVDYSYQQYKYLDNTHSFGVSLTF